jgi:hypothetical protein
MRLEILDGEILLGGRVVARVVDGLPYAIESELVSRRTAKRLGLIKVPP